MLSLFSFMLLFSKQAILNVKTYCFSLQNNRFLKKKNLNTPN
ncbi:hypothetical protein HMPREF0653_02576 [Prevotella disiens JCM 6334 = ATCC 29426]|uniref:Uncharacterized protein n=1 Tax=Prevotella disiens JCM 6334 = ATCC 29426 TaxID=1235811 RepID=A0ABN0NNV9_9BACT|nr:hypothetical protein HMPREF0653_02576 [Prevotella disiens JCM 6334 = ATCC 29426]